MRPASRLQSGPVSTHGQYRRLERLYQCQLKTHQHQHPLSRL
ncbi:hypothetical protein FAMCQIZV_CDS0013 [Phage C72C1]|nr:hypothetical protein FAMCQIZV_CDS0013 [Phage C72C1]